MTLALAACKNRTQIIGIAGFSMGTTYNVALVDHDNQWEEAEVKVAVETALASVNQQLSNWDAHSEISQFNRRADHELVTMSDALAQVMAASAVVNSASEGRFDTTIGPLIELWGFGAPGNPSLPAQAAIDDAIERSGQLKTLMMAGDQIAKRHADAQIYLSGIGKGFGADRVSQALKGMGAQDFMVEIGGDLFASGRNPDGLPWQIGIESPNPVDRSVAEIVGLTGLGLATSGDYRNYFEAAGKRFSHLIDPTTGYPVTHATASATVLAENAMLADAWSTAMLILGRERGLEIAEKHNVAVQFIDHDPRVEQRAFNTYVSAAFEKLTA